MKYFWSYFYLFYFKRLVAHWQQHLPKRTLTLPQNSSELELPPLELLVPEQASVAFLIPIYNSIWICSFILICHLFIIFYTGIGSVFGSLIVGYTRNPSSRQPGCVKMIMKPLDEVLNDLEVRNHEFKMNIILVFLNLVGNPRNFIH